MGPPVSSAGAFLYGKVPVGKAVVYWETGITQREYCNVTKDGPDGIRRWIHSIRKNSEYLGYTVEIFSGTQENDIGETEQVHPRKDSM